MHSNPIRRIKPSFLVALAVLLDGILDGYTNYFVRQTSLSIFIALRLILESALFFGLIALLSAVTDEEKQEIRLHPFSIDLEIYARAIFLLIFLVSFTLMLGATSSQTLAYSIFFFHPFWQLFVSWLVWKARPNFKAQLGPMLIIFSGVCVLALIDVAPAAKTLGWIKALFGRPPEFYVVSLVAGWSFAILNESLSFVSTMSETEKYKIGGGSKDNRLSGLRINFQTYYTALLVGTPIAITLVWINQNMILNFWMSFSYAPDFYLASPLPYYFLLAAFISVLGGWFVSEAFSVTVNTARLAAVDGLTVVVAVGNDLRRGALSVSDPYFPAIILAGVLIVFGVWKSANPKR